jgi:hypothetical protein
MCLGNEVVICERGIQGVREPLEAWRLLSGEALKAVCEMIWGGAQGVKWAMT